MALPTSVGYKLTMTGHFSPFLSPDKLSDALPGVYLAHFLENLLPDPGHRAALLAESGLTNQPLGSDHSVGLQPLLCLIELIDREARPGWHIEPSLAMEAAHHGPLGVAVVSAASVADALRTLTEFQAVRAAFVHISADMTDAGWQARMMPMSQPKGPWHMLMEINLLALACLIQRLLPPRTRAPLLTMPDRYRPWQARFGNALTGQIRFDGQEYRLLVPQELLALHCPLGDRRLHADAVARCRAILAERSRYSPLEAEIRRRVMVSLSAPPTLDQMAQCLGLSKRTLHRRLQTTGRTYRGLLDEVRASVAANLLRESGAPIATIAEELGYQDTANFGRACRRWFGCAPGALRHRDRDDPPKLA